MSDDDFERFAEGQAVVLARLAYRLTGHRESARDLVQDALLEAFRHWSKVSRSGNPAGYVRRILINHHLNAVRRRRPVEVADASWPEAQADTAASDLSADRYADQDAMWRALAGLSGRQRTVLVLRRYEGLDDPAIAQLLGCRRATVRSLAARALAALRTSPHLQQPAAGPAGRSMP